MTADTPGRAESPRVASPRATSPQATEPGWLRDVALVTIISAIAVASAQAARPVVTYRAIELGATPFEIGLVQSVYSLLPMLTAIALGRWTDRFGEALVTAVGCVALAIGAVVLALSSSLLGLAVGQVLMGFGVIAVAIATQSFVANRGPAGQQVHRFGWFSVAVSAGQIVGPAVVAVLVPTQGSLAAANAAPNAGEVDVFVFAALTAVLAMALLWGLPRAVRRGAGTGPAAEPNPARAAMRVLRTPGIPAAMFVSLAVASGLDVLIVYLPALGDATGLTVATVGGLLSVRAGATLVSRVFMGRMSDSLGPGRTMMLTTAVAAIAVGLLPVVGPVPVLYLLMVLIGLGLGIGQPLSVAWIGIQSPPNARGLAFGVRHTGNLATLLVVPAGMGLIAGAAGIHAIWQVMAVFLGLAAIVAARTRFASSALASTG